jgi:hypothetical protein
MLAAVGAGSSGFTGSNAMTPSSIDFLLISSKTILSSNVYS